LQDIATTNFTGAGTNFTYEFPPLSMTLFTFYPGAPVLSAPGIQSGQLQLLLQGQPGTPYEIESSSNLVTWSAVWSNTLSGTSSNINIPVSASPQQFYRAVWQP
ncbi:MAG TPA: hypothetical protein VGN61_11705, partial [Verrucomicrobiae bacterium]